MNRIALRRQPHALLPDFSELFAAFPPISGLRPALEGHLIRVEDEVAEGHYVVRAELPGIDPAKDVDIVVRDGQLTIKAERTEEKKDDSRSEFSYGSFVRTMTLPAGSDEDDIKATYDKGILTVSIAVSEPTSPEKHITVESAN